MASSTELSTTSQTRWCSPVGPVEPMYIPGRWRTGSSPSRTVMSVASYEDSRALSTTSGSAFSATNAPFHIIERGGEPQRLGSSETCLVVRYRVHPVYQGAVPPLRL